MNITSGGQGHWKDEWQNEGEKCDISEVLRGRNTEGIGRHLPEKELAELLVVLVAGGFEIFRSGLGLFHFALVRQLQRTVNLTN